MLVDVRRQDRPVRHHHAQQEGPRGIAVKVDLADQGTAASEEGFQPGDRDKLALRELEHVVAAIQIADRSRCNLLHDVAGVIEAIGIHERCVEIVATVVSTDQPAGAYGQFAARVWFVGREIAQVRHVEQAIVQHRRAHHLAVYRDHPGFGGAIAIDQREAEELLDKGPEFRGKGRGARSCRPYPATKQTLAQDAEIMLPCAATFSTGELVDQFADPGHQRYVGGTAQ